jgi:hypothetical protein
MAFVLPTLLVAQSASADRGEKADATRLCAEAVTQGRPRLSLDDVRNICEASNQPVQVWDCAKKRMNDGASFGLAVEDCKTARK